jgi:serine/threonine protein kinase
MCGGIAQIRGYGRGIVRKSQTGWLAERDSDGGAGRALGALAMPDSTSRREPIEELAESFLARLRAGERPALSEFTAAHPELAEQIRELFPALLELEQAGSEIGAAPGTAAPPADAGVTPLESLGDYWIIGEVGRGGMGVVYEAVQESLGRHVALKVLAPSTRADPKLIERCRREARASARLHHTNIVPVFGAGEEGAYRYYAMQFIQGQGLDAILHELRRLRRAPGPQRAGEPGFTQSAPLSALVAHSLLTGGIATQATAGDSDKTAAELDAGDLELGDGLRKPAPSAPSSDASHWASQPGSAFARTIGKVGLPVAGALAHADEQGILHRDIKPSNLLLDIAGNVWVTDFGLAKSDDAEALTEACDIVGTIRYMAPERFHGVSGPESDIYGVGVTFYELLTLRPAFENADRATLIDQILHTDPPSPRSVDPEIQRDLETIVLKAMSKHPSDRYRSAWALAEDLEMFLQDRGILARRSSVSERLWRWCERNPLVAGSTGAVEATLLAVALISLFHAREQARATSQIKGLAADLGNERASLRKSLAASNRLLAIPNFDRGRAAFETDQIGAGLLWMIKSWRSALAAGDPACEHAARVNLAAWQPCHAPLKALLSHPALIEAAVFSPDCKAVLTGGRNGTARLCDATSGVPTGRSLEGRHDRQTFAAFNPDGRTIVTAGAITVRISSLGSELPDDLDRVATWVEVITGLTREKHRRSIQVLGNAAARRGERHAAEEARRKAVELGAVSPEQLNHDDEELLRFRVEAATLLARFVPPEPDLKRGPTP